MKQINYILMILLTFLASLSFPTLFAEMGLGLATPIDSTVTVDAFPFTFSGSFRVYNTGDEDGVLVVRVGVPYADINDWIFIDTSIFLLKGQESKVIHFNVTTEESYTGSYEILFQPTLLPSYDAESGAMAYLGVSSLFRFTVVVPPEVGDLSLGERPPGSEEEWDSEDFTRHLGGLNETGVVVETFGKTIVLDLPSNPNTHDTYDVSVSFVGGGEPVGLGFVFVAPSGKQIKCPMTSVITFDEAGEWIVLVVVEDQMILGKTFSTQYSLMVDLLNRNFLQYIILIASASVIVFLFLRRKKKKEEEIDEMEWPELPYYFAKLQKYQ